MKACLTLILTLMAAMAAQANEAAVQRGALVFKKCQSCHKVGAGAGNGVGPHLNGLFGRRAGSIDGAQYSDDMKMMGGDGLVWNYETLNIYLENPKNLVSRTRMKFGGLKAKADRDDVLAYLRTFSASPQNIPESAPTEPSEDPLIDAAVLAMEGDPDYGEYLSSECVTCHRADGADAGIPSITGWPKEDFMVALIAYREKYRPNEAMRLVASRLSNEEIAGLAAYFGARGN